MPRSHFENDFKVGDIFHREFLFNLQQFREKAGVDCLKVATPYHQMIVHKLGYLEELKL
jgi:hypothetical protein